MKKTLGLTALFLGTYIVFVIALLPANWLLSQVKLPNDVHLIELEGTIWNSEIKQLIVNDIVINRAQASLKLASLLSFNPAVEIHFGDALLSGPEGRLTISGLLSDFAITDAEIYLPANMIAEQLDLAIDITAHQQVKLTLAEFVQGQPICSSVIGRLQWRKAAITAFEEKIALGDLAAKLTCDKGELVATVEPNNDLGLTYQAKMKQWGQFSGSGYLLPDEKFPSLLREALPFLGSADKKGRYRLKI